MHRAVAPALPPGADGDPEADRRDGGDAGRGSGFTRVCDPVAGEAHLAACVNVPGLKYSAVCFPDGAALTGLQVHPRLRVGSPAKAFTPRAGKGADANIFTPAGRPEWFRTGR
ncbi:hypothetical protein KOSB73_240082 [Klebsiella grimontii]|uniref:Uncharacterized protein n=1 Tax=Klebsiella grimontii TaxID=2058152 RepID=A0A285B1Z3_9ENTR|nr:hypothetical protein KOSB73_240082 [Klebsiella grimontii]